MVQYHGTGGRKTSGARVWISEGSGRYIINGKLLEQYICGRRLLHKMAMEPFVATNTLGKYDVYADAYGGGICSQIGAVRQAVSKAITRAKPEHRPVLRKAGLLTRDPRVKERKKYGQKRARKKFQYSKR
ncbi:MAG: 30S ribosomal protein S9 [bacterium]